MAQKYIVGDVVMYKNRIHTVIDIFDVRVFEFHFIHELQHLLFGLGINHEMEV